MLQKYKKLKLFLFKRPHWKPDHLNQNPELFGLLVHPDFSGPVKITFGNVGKTVNKRKIPYSAE